MDKQRKNQKPKNFRKNMKTNFIKTFGAGIAALALMLGLGTSAQASLVIQQVSAPVYSDSWGVDFIAQGVTFDEITGTILGGGSTFEISPNTGLAPFPYPPGWGNTFNTSLVSSIVGPATSQLLFTGTFTGLPTDPPPVTVEFSVYDNNALVGVTTLFWNQSGNSGLGEFDVVPEPTTMIAGALLLLPFGASTLRILRNKQLA